MPNINGNEMEEGCVCYGWEDLWRSLTEESEMTRTTGYHPSPASCSNAINIRSDASHETLRIVRFGTV